MPSGRLLVGPPSPKAPWPQGKWRRGATTLELTILLVLLIILTAVASPNMGPVVQRYRLRGAAWQLVGDLRLARQRAVTIRKRFRVCVTGCAIAVPIHSYSLERDDGTITTPLWNSESGAAAQLPPGVSLHASAAAATFNQTGMASGATFTLRNLMGTYEVTIDSTGRAKVCQGTCAP